MTAAAAEQHVILHLPKQVEHVARIRIREGDTLVLECSHSNLTLEDADRLIAEIRGKLPKGADVILLEGMKWHLDRA